MIMGCFEDYMDFREKVDRITKKGNANEDPKIKAPINPKDAMKARR